ncbi:MAG: type I DNA topoisomerase [Clostridia bacterium]|nr:type I DNA topoisomerase [Clostridia bacterium]
MNTKLVIVESPAKARTIARFLGRGYKVEASNGHIRDLPKSQMGIDIENGFTPKYITIRGRGDILDKIRKEARGATKIYLATDPDREGEAISWHLAQILGVDPAEPCRVVFNEITAKVVKNAVKNPRPIDMELVNAQQARRLVDRLVGYKISPLLWMKIKKGLSAGRVQSVATRLIVDREQEIDAFIPEEYWDIGATAMIGTGGKGQRCAVRFVGLDGKKAELKSQADSDGAKARIEAAKLTVMAVKPSERKKNPAPPFTTSNLQQEAARKLGYTTAKTMRIAQELYEGVDVGKSDVHGLISYIRTDSVRVSDEAQSEARAAIAERYGPEYVPAQPNVYKGRKTAQDAHEAIRPTELSLLPDQLKAALTKEQYNLYKLVYNRFLASQMTPAIFETLTLDIAGDGVSFRFYGEQKRFPGFTAVYEEGTDEEVEQVETTLPKANPGDPVALSDIACVQHFTQPPPRYTEASLVRALEEKGIGRPSTYAPTISTILARGYVVREKKRLFPTELGEMVTGLMEQYFQDIVDVEFTAGLEEQLDTVEVGGMPWKDVVSRFYGPLEKYLEVAEASIEKVEVKPEESDIPCDKCGAMMVYKMGRFGKFLACPKFPECRNTKPIQIEIDAPCPKCGAKLLEKNSRKGRKFYGCEKYPDCDFVSWEMPVVDKCPACGGYMTLKRGRKGEMWHICANTDCKHRVEIEETEGADE